jgi:4-oxalocrotonate tautomerase
MPLIEAKIWPGRTAEEKATLARKLIDATTEAMDVPARSVRIIIYEIPKDNWAAGGEDKPARA